MARVPGFITTMYADPEKQLTSVNIGGIAIEVPKDGIIEVPTANVTDLKSHGFSTTPFKGQQSAEDEEPASKPKTGKGFRIGSKRAAA